MRGNLRWLCLLGALISLLSWTEFARAESALTLEAAPVLGSHSPSVEGWGEIYVRLNNSGELPRDGYVELRALLLGRGAPRALSRAPFSIPAKGKINLFLPSHGLVSRASDAKVVAIDAAGNELASEQLAPLRQLEPLIFDLNNPSRLVAALNTKPVPIRRRGLAYSYGGTTLSVSTPQINPSTGEAVLPDLAAGYASATLVLASGRVLSSLSKPARDALFSWLLSGGALALVIDRPEDVHSAWLQALAGGPVQSTAVSRSMSASAQFAVPIETGGRGGMGGGAPHISLQSAKPSAELAESFFGLSGANLRLSPWGEAASYGLGEVHFLAFNPDTELAAGDLWARLKLVDLVRHAWERANVVALPHAQAALDELRGANVRRVLDPNEGTRWTVVVSALLLLIYAALAGPLNFYLAQRAGRPLRSLVHLPIYAAVALCAIVLLGVLGKGVTGRARHLTLIEAGAGMSRAAVTRFRGLYGSRADDVTVRAARGSVLDVLGSPDEVTRDLVVDRDGLRLSRLRQKPWEVQVIREDGFVNLGAGVSMTLGSDGQLTIKNRCARDLLGVVVNAPGRGLFYFPKLADGETVGIGQGRPLGALPPASPIGTHVLSVGNFRDRVEERARGAGVAWEALEVLTGVDADWWPGDVPALIAQLEGGEGRTQDSGLRLDLDRVLLRVVGLGGVP